MKLQQRRIKNPFYSVYGVIVIPFPDICFFVLFSSLFLSSTKKKHANQLQQKSKREKEKGINKRQTSYLLT